MFLHVLGFVVAGVGCTSGFIALFLETGVQLLALLQFVLKGGLITFALGLEFRVVALQGVHFPLETGLGLSSQLGLGAIFNCQASLERLELCLPLMEIFFELIELSAHTVDLEVLLFDGDKDAGLFLALSGGFLGLALGAEAALVQLVL